MKMKKGGMGTNIIVFLLFLAFGVAVYDWMTPAAYPTATNPFVFNYQNLVSAFTQSLLDLQLTSWATLGGTFVAIIGTFVFPNPYAIFLGISIALLGLVAPGAAIPTILSSVGFTGPVGDLLNAVVVAIFCLAILGWYAGRDTI